MLFGSYRTGTERLVSEIVRNQTIDTAPSKKYLLGNDIAILNLRPAEVDKVVGRNGRFRQKAHSGEQRILDRMRNDVPVYLSQDAGVNKQAHMQLAETDIKQMMLEKEK